MTIFKSQSVGAFAAKPALTNHSAAALLTQAA